MTQYQKLQAYVPPLIIDWIRDQAAVRETTVSVVVRELLVTAWTRDSDQVLRPAGADPERQHVFMTVALDALLAHHDDPTLRERTLAAYHRRLAKLGLVSAPIRGGDDEA